MSWLDMFMPIIKYGSVVVVVVGLFCLLACAIDALLARCWIDR